MYYPTIFLIIFIISVPIIWYLTKLDKEHFSNNNIYTEKDKEKEKVAIASLIRKPIDLTIWLKRLREIGISHFFYELKIRQNLKTFLKHNPI
jgi:hypothetical protein